MSLREHYLRYGRPQRQQERPLQPGMLETLMRNIDFESTLLRLGITAKPCNSRGEYCGFCPDHEQYKGAAPSHPRWYINSRTGLSYCQTEARGSNLIEIAKNLLGLRSSRETIEKLLDGRPLEIRFTPGTRVEPVEETPPDEEKRLEAIASVEPFFDAGRISGECIAFFERDGITFDTLQKFGVVSCAYGRYRDRALVPFLGSELKLAGFIAIDLLGREEWTKRQTQYVQGAGSSGTFEEIYSCFLKKYRKTLYCPGFRSREHLYGFYENFSFLKQPPDSLVLVEGERDALKLMQEGIPCLGIHGTHVKEEQRLLLKSSGILSNLRELFLGFDMDEAGNEAVTKAFELFSTELDSDRIYVLNFPGGRDPKKFRREELLSLMQICRDQKIHTRRGAE